MRTSAAGRKAIAAHEGNKLTAYLDSVGVLTIGVGHTTAAGPPEVKKGMKITDAQSDEILTRDLAAVEADINRLVKVPVNQSQFDALVSLVFNIGGTAFRKSTLLKKLNAGDTAGAAEQFLVLNKGTVNGKKVAIKGLTTRRQNERKQFLSGDTQAAQAPAAGVTPATVVDPAGRTDAITVRIVQETLRDKGYTEVGVPDGKIGKLTKTAILAAKNENDITPINDVIDDAFLIALPGIPARNLPRDDAKPATVRQNAPEVRTNWLMKILGGLGLGTVGVGGVGDKVLGAITPWKDTFSDIPGWVWIGAALLVFGAVAFAGWYGERKGIAAYQEGARR
ncbi:hypothetical protein EPK99_06360 [Neorhizobium lilium]|uniref:Lysozyme n=2 Tax=Neorhizobium lilium TaxID=2503024 RepID=A0A444LK34_9HYPH|nr:hypothetical protein EPK99_06360 [Neorhizobium lilium]